MGAVGVRELKNQLSRYLRRVRAGERLVITERGRPIAIVTSPTANRGDRRIQALLREGLARWDGGKPKGAARPPKIKGPSVARAVIEDRR